MIAAFARAPRADAIAELAAGGAPFDEVAQIDGRLYLTVMRALISARDNGAITSGAINAPIGGLRAQLRAWLLDADKRKSAPLWDEDRRCERAPRSLVSPSMRGFP